MLYPPLIDGNLLKKLADLLAYAEAYRYDLETMRRWAAGQIDPMQSHVGHSINFSGYNITLTIEQQPNGWCRHLSVMQMEGVPNRYPHPMAVESIMAAAGFPLIQKCAPWTAHHPKTFRGIVHVLAEEKDCTRAPREPNFASVGFALSPITAE